MRRGGEGGPGQGPAMVCLWGAPAPRNEERRRTGPQAAEKPGVGPALLPAADRFSCSANMQSKAAYSLRPPPLTPRPAPTQSVRKNFPPARSSRNYRAARRKATQRTGCARRLGRGFKDFVGGAPRQREATRLVLLSAPHRKDFATAATDPCPHTTSTSPGPGL